MNIKQLNKFIKLLKMQIDNLQRERVLLSNSINALELDYKNLSDEKQREMDFICNHPDDNLEYESFFTNLHVRQNLVKNQIHNLQQKSFTIEQEIILLSTEQKKYEILIEQARKKELEIEAKSELKALDEFNQQKTYHGEQS